MEETMKLLGLLGIAIFCNILGGIYVNITLHKFTFSWKKLAEGIAKALCVALMFLGLAFIVEKIPNLSETLGVEPKAMIVSAIAIYSAKVVKHLTEIFGIEPKANIKQIESAIENKLDEYVDR